MGYMSYLVNQKLKKLFWCICLWWMAPTLAIWVFRKWIYGSVLVVILGLLTQLPARHTACMSSSSLLPTHSPGPGGAPFEKVLVPRLPGKSAEPRHTGLCYNIALPKVIIALLCVPPAGPWVLRKVNWNSHRYILKARNARLRRTVLGLRLSNPVSVFIIKKTVFKTVLPPSNYKNVSSDLTIWRLSSKDLSHWWW